MKEPMRGILAVLIALLLGASACTSSSSTSTAGEGKPSAGEQDSSGGASQGGGGGSGEDSKESDLGPAITASGRFASAVGSTEDPPDDAQVTGTVPDFVEILEGSVEGSPDELALKLSMSGAVPETMPDESTTVIVAWNLAASKKAPTVGITAQGGTDGWAVSSAIDNEPVDWPGSFSIEGDTIVLTVPWNFVTLPHSFDWSAAVSYYATNGDEAAGSADNIPEGHFPDEGKT